MTDTKNRPVSPVNGQPLPIGRPNFAPGEEARELGRQGGLASGKKRRARKTLRQELLDILSDMEVKDKVSGKMLPVQEAMSAKLVEQVMKGNVRAYEIIRDTIGEKPVENVNVVTADYTALNDAFEGLKTAIEAAE